MKTMTRFIAVILSVFVMLSVIPRFAFAAEETETTVISTFEELQKFADDVNNGNTYEGKTVKLNANISAEDVEWTPIGNSKNKFSGTFDGDYHTVIINITSGSYVGLFGYVDKGTIKNLVVDGAVNGSSNTAGVVGYLNAGTVENCANKAAVSGGSAVGGVVGYSGGAFTVDGCFNTGDITGTTGYIGGVVGNAYGKGTVKNSYNVGTVTGPATVGGVGGGHKAGNTSFENCFNAGEIVDTAGADNNIGAVVGKTRGTVTNCYCAKALANLNNYNYTEVEDFSEIDVTALGDSFKSGTAHPVLKWESNISTGEFVKPKYAEKTELAAELSEYIKSALNSAKANAKLSASDKLFSSEGYLSGASSTATDWLVLALGRYGYYNQKGEYVYLIDEGYDEYLSAMKTYIETTYKANNGILHSRKATEWHRAVVTIKALGGDPTNFGAYNDKPINLIADGSYDHLNPGMQGINGWIWGLIALDTGDYEIPENAKNTREKFITEILSRQLTDGVNGNEYGGWVLGGYGTSSDVDITAMAIQALAPYYNDDTVYTYTNGNSKKEVSKTVRQCVDEALDCLGAKMDENGTFSSWSTNNVEGVSQVLVALCSLGIDPAKDERFITESGKTILDGVLKFRLKDGGFCHVIGGSFNSMANDQAAYALVSYWRFESGMRALYDMRDDFSESDRAAINAAVEAIDNLPKPTAEKYKASLKDALEKFRAVPESERRYVGNYSALAAAIELVGGEKALDTDEPYIVSVSIAKAPDKTDYTEGDIFDPKGMSVVAVYSDGSAKAIEDYKITPSGELALGDTAVYVTYGILKAKVDITVAEKFPWKGEGTENSPYLIGNADELSALAERVNGKKSTTGMYFALTNNIDLSSIENWKPIGSSSGLMFDGNFNGCGYAIDNLYSTQGGLFGYVGNNAVIKNVGVASGEINSKSSFVGGIVGWSNGADIINCWNGADITASGYFGGIVGTVRDGGKSVISGCYNVGNLTATGLSPVGGIVGHLDTSRNNTSVEVTIENCYNAGNISGKDSLGCDMGGIIGKMQDGHSVKNCFSIGKITPITVEGSKNPASVGAIFGSATNKNTFSDCYYDKAISTNEETDGITAKTTEEMQSDEFLKTLGKAFIKDKYGAENGGYPILSYQNTYKTEEIDKAVESINKIPENVSLEDEKTIADAREIYDSLDEELKTYVPNLTVLENAEKALIELKNKPADDPTDEPSQTPDEPDDKPAQTPSKEFVDEKHSEVTVTAQSGVISENAVLNVELVEESENENSVTYDISFDNGVQPNGMVTVKIALPDFLKNAKNIYVYHITDGGYYERVKNAVLKDGCAVFETDHFSRYIVTSTEITEKSPDTGAADMPVCICIMALSISALAAVIMRKKAR